MSVHMCVCVWGASDICLYERWDFRVQPANAHWGGALDSVLNMFSRKVFQGSRSHESRSHLQNIVQETTDCSRKFCASSEKVW